MVIVIYKGGIMESNRGLVIVMGHIVVGVVVTAVTIIVVVASMNSRCVQAVVFPWELTSSG